MDEEYLEIIATTENNSYIDLLIKGWNDGLRGEELKKFADNYSEKVKNNSHVYNEAVGKGMDEENLKILSKLKSVEEQKSYLYAWEIGMDQEHLEKMSEINYYCRMNTFRKAWDVGIRGEDLETITNSDGDIFCINAWKAGMEDKNFQSLMDMCKRGESVENINMYCTTYFTCLFDDEYIEKIMQANNKEEMLSILKEHHEE